MRFRLVALALASFLAVGTAQAQSGGASAHPSCVGQAADACQQAVDFFGYMAPQLGTAMTGGNTTLAQGGSLGGMRFGLVPRFAIGVRVNAVQGNRPVYNPTVAPLAPSNAPPPAAKEIATENQVVPLPAVDLALGVFKGIPLALSNVGGVDLLLSASFVPNVGDRATDDFALEVDESLALGYGVRVGLLQESLVVPGVGFSYMQRKFPKTTLFAKSDNAVGTASLEVRDLDLKSNAWRLTVSKSLLLFGLAAGVGQDAYDVSTSILATQSPAAPVSAAVSSKVTRTNYFADVSMNLLVLKLVGTVGMVSGGDIVTYNSYDNAADKSRLYGSVGVRFGL
ncbi:MAG TPA: hypothetical protein VFO66_03330 [Gemmatimonadaceae bacterium]|nr:hypothetical protein [Gemmatimonadaceae bacterium]